MEYNEDYAKDALSKWVQQYDKDYESAKYTIEIDGVFKDPDIMLFCQYLDKAGDPQYQDMMIRQCILGLNVSIKLDGVVVGSFVLNNLTDSWGSIPVFKMDNHPLGYAALNNTVMAYLAKKSTLPRKKIASEAAAVAQK